MAAMRARQVGGALRRAKRVYVFVRYSADDGVFIEVPKTCARLIVNEVRGTDVTVDADERADGLYIG